MAHALECEACAASLTFAHYKRSLVDEAVAKALVVSEMAKIARSEARARTILLKHWDNRAKFAAKAGAAAIRGGASAVVKAVDGAMDKFAADVAVPFGVELQTTYVHARVAGLKRAKRKVARLDYTVESLEEKIAKAEYVAKAKFDVGFSFDMYDESAVKALMNDQMVWVGRHYRAGVREAVIKTASESIRAGSGLVTQGKVLEAALTDTLGWVNAPGGWRGTAKDYFEGIASNAMTVGRVRGVIRSFRDVGVTRYVLSNPNDSQTSRICSLMDGKVFLVEQAATQIEKEAGATKPDDIRRDHPWISAAEASKIHAAGGTKALADAGLSLPPYHFRCRTTVDVDDSISYRELTSTERASVPETKPRPTPPPIKPRTKIPTPSVPVPALLMRPKPIPPAASASTLPATLPPNPGELDPSLLIDGAPL